MEPNGKEVREGWDPMDMSYMQLLDAAGPTEDAPAEAEEAPPDPGEIIKIFEDAKGNLDILVDVVTNLERSFIEAKPFSAGRRPGVKREDAVANSLQSRVAATSGSLLRVSRRLAGGAELLKAHVEREDKFYQQLRQLQMFWKHDVIDIFCLSFSLHFAPLVSSGQVHLNPRVVDCPFMVDILAAGQALTGNTYELGSGSLLVPLMKGDGGALRVQVGAVPGGTGGTMAASWWGCGGVLGFTEALGLELPLERPNVNDPSRVGETRLNGKGARTQLVVGSRRVHALLLQLQRRQLWRRVAAGLERDAASQGLVQGGGAGAAAAGGAGTSGATAAAAPAGGGGGSGGAHPVHTSLARLAAQNVLRTSDPSLAALRPLMLEHLVACRLPPPYKPPPPRPAVGTRGLHHPYGGAAYGGVLSSVPLLPDLAALLNHIVFRDHQIYHLDLEAHALPYITLRWRSCSTSLLTSAMEIRVGPSHRVLVLVRDGRTDVEGVVQATGLPSAGSGAGGSRWVRDTHMGFSRHDVPCVLRAVLQTLGVPLDRLLGVSALSAQNLAQAQQQLPLALAAQNHGGGSGVPVLHGQMPPPPPVLAAPPSAPLLGRSGGGGGGGLSLAGHGAHLRHQPPLPTPLPPPQQQLQQLPDDLQSQDQQTQYQLQQQQQQLQYGGQTQPHQDTHSYSQGQSLQPNHMQQQQQPLSPPAPPPPPHQQQQQQQQQVAAATYQVHMHGQYLPQTIQQQQQQLQQQTPLNQHQQQQQQQQQQQPYHQHHAQHLGPPQLQQQQQPPAPYPQQQQQLQHGMQQQPQQPYGGVAGDTSRGLGTLGGRSGAWGPQG
ncbi:hypothetical protein VOLCADRAFT_92554 [Volvox carteri f. nagariensis]|uniref:Uncharacterized protein n=1 Tax=Volvox carteri f. nagariensis TaxID=3068 RepID=D8TZZ0_VOLCA|nr:uncharacterized protein VOLCADRAFT_92554 [Volvox carteri f. nagariensis]EFJ47014.1 hypothetical protein VOLCADRAFT_92554 [Volvox carteri f. nagariensis]|eukprot:XP_002951909.1 hypothetical protein VOLCADRAFT_92554 [Volvox carteri f. nagariensis]